MLWCRVFDAAAESPELIPYSEIARRIGVTEKSIRETCDPYFRQLMAERTFELPPVIGMDKDHFKAFYEIQYTERKL